MAYGYISLSAAVVQKVDGRPPSNGWSFYPCIQHVDLFLGKILNPKYEWVNAD